MFLIIEDGLQNREFQEVGQGMLGLLYSEGTEMALPHFRFEVRLKRVLNFLSGMPFSPAT